MVRYVRLDLDVFEWVQRRGVESVYDPAEQSIFRDVAHRLNKLIGRAKLNQLLGQLVAAISGDRKQPELVRWRRFRREILARIQQFVQNEGGASIPEQQVKKVVDRLREIYNQMADSILPTLPRVLSPEEVFASSVKTVVGELVGEEERKELKIICHAIQKLHRAARKKLMPGYAECASELDESEWPTHVLTMLLFGSFSLVLELTESV